MNYTAVNLLPVPVILSCGVRIEPGCKTMFRSYPGTMIRSDLNTLTYKLGAKTEIFVGGVGYEDDDGSFKNSYSQIDGVRIHNHLPFNLNVYYDDNLVVIVPVGENVYFDNATRGLNLCDKIEFARNSDNKKLYAISLVNKNISDVHVGMII